MWIVIAHYTSRDGDGHMEVLAIRATESLARARMVELAETYGTPDEDMTVTVENGEWMYNVDFVEDV
jgi:hypothetical protein